MSHHLSYIHDHISTCILEAANYTQSTAVDNRLLQCKVFTLRCHSLKSKKYILSEKIMFSFNFLLMHGKVIPILLSFSLLTQRSFITKSLMLTLPLHSLEASLTFSTGVHHCSPEAGPELSICWPPPSSAGIMWVWPLSWLSLLSSLLNYCLHADISCPSYQPNSCI